MTQRCPVNGILCGCLTLCNPNTKEPRVKMPRCLACGELQHPSIAEQVSCLSNELSRLKTSVEVSEVEKLKAELDRLKAFEATVKRPFLESQRLPMSKGGQNEFMANAGKKNKGS